MEEIEADKQFDRYDIRTYKYLGDVNYDNLEYIFIDLEAHKCLPIEKLEEIINKSRKSVKLSIFYSEKFGSFILEPRKI